MGAGDYIPSTEHGTSIRYQWHEGSNKVKSHYQRLHDAPGSGNLSSHSASDTLLPGNFDLLFPPCKPQPSHLRNGSLELMVSGDASSSNLVILVLQNPESQHGVGLGMGQLYIPTLTPPKTSDPFWVPLPGNCPCLFSGSL